MSSPAVPSWTGVALSVILVVMAAVVAWRSRLGLVREIVVAAVRAAIQLVAVGALLLVLFKHAHVPGALAWVGVMVIIAGQVAGRRGAGVPGARTVATYSVGMGVAATLGLLLISHVVPVEPRVVVPVGGMVVSGAMQASALVLLRLREQAETARPQVEARLALGLSAKEAMAPLQRSALRAAMLPSIDNTKVVGLISLPGAMTGLILAGVTPLTAIRYQVVVMYMLLAAAALAGVATSLLAYRQLVDDAQRLKPLVTAGAS